MSVPSFLYILAKLRSFAFGKLKNEIISVLILFGHMRVWEKESIEAGSPKTHCSYSTDV